MKGHFFKRVISIFVVLCILISATPCFSAAGTTSIVTGKQYQESLELLETDVFEFVADANQYYRFNFRNQSVEVNTGIAFGVFDWVLNLFVGKMSITIYDQYNERLTSFDVRAGYTGSISLQLKKEQKYHINVSTTVAGNYSMSVEKLADAGGNTWQTATETTATAQTVAGIDAAGDRDWFTFVAGEEGAYYDYQLENIQCATLYFYLYEYVEGAGATPLRDVFNYSVYNNSTGSKDIKLKPGSRYYYCILSTDTGTGGYVLNAVKSLDAAGNSIGEAYPIRLEEKVTSSIDGTGDNDYYRFTTGADPAYYHVKVNSISSVYMNCYLYNTAGDVIDKFISYGSTGFTISDKLTPKTDYILRILNNSSGREINNYEFNISCKIDTYGDTLADAGRVETDTKYTTNIGGYNDKDYIKFTTGADPAYYHVTVKSTSSEYMNCYLYNTAGDIIDKFLSYGSTEFTISDKLTPQTDYIVCIFNYSSSHKINNYEFCISCKPDTYGDALADAGRVETDTKYTTNIGGYNDKDYIKFTTGADPAYYHVTVKSTSSEYMNCYLYNTAGDIIDKFLSYGSTEFTVSDKLTPQTDYIVCIFNNSSSHKINNYEFCISCKPDTYGDALADAGRVETDTKYTTNIGGYNDKDYIKFTTGADPAYYHVKVNSISSVYMNCYLYNTAGDVIDKFLSYGSTEFTISDRLTPQTDYIVCIFNYSSNHQINNYEFIITTIPDAEGETQSDAAEIPLNAKQQKDLASDSDVDWYKIVVTNQIDCGLTLVNESCSSVRAIMYGPRDATIFDLSGSKETHKIIEPGTYYIKVSGRKGYYTLIVSSCGGGHRPVPSAAVAPGCTTPGKTAGSYCSVCGTVIQEPGYIAPLGHTWNDGKMTLLPTDTTEGSKTLMCTRCGETKVESVPSIQATVLPFRDVAAGQWFYNAVRFSYACKLFSGTSANTFAPNGDMTRAMLVSVLWRLDGNTAPQSRNVFKDVPAGQWYTNAVIWASENEIVTGVGGGSFNPNGNVTREQIAAIMFRYAKYKKYDVSKSQDLSVFPDVGKVSGWAYTALSWANAEGLITGSSKNGETVLDPGGNASRAQVATIMMRYVQNIVNAE